MLRWRTLTLIRPVPVSQRKRGGNLRKSLEPVVTEHSIIVVETGTQTDPIATATIEIQTELSVFHSTVLIPEPVQVVSVPFETQTERPPSPPPALAFPVPTPSSQELRQKLANDLGIELEQLERFVEKDNREPSIPGTFTPPSPAGGLRPEGVYLPRRVGRWASRLSPRAMSQAPAKIVDVSHTQHGGWLDSNLDDWLTLAVALATGLPPRGPAASGADSRLDCQLRALLGCALPVGCPGQYILVH